MEDLWSKLESNQQEDVDAVKLQFHESFNTTKESWLLNGLFDYYISTNSARSVEILVNVKDPHDKYLFDKLSETIRTPNTKLQALTLLGHVVRRQPSWLYKITQHQLFKDLLKLLKTETEILPLLSALLVLIVLLPMIPAFVGPTLPDIFEVFSRLAAWNCHNPGKFVDEQLVHLQVALYALFIRLYGMYPCNFLAYLRNQYRNREMMPIFTHTIKPMLDTVKMHPLLVLSSKDNETTTGRWKKMGHHDVIVECEKFSLDITEHCREESCFFMTAFRSRSGTTTGPQEPVQPVPEVLTAAAWLNSIDSGGSIGDSSDKEFWSPTVYFHSQSPPLSEISTPTPIPHAQGLVTSARPQQEGTSPPEAAVEATAETLIKDVRVMSSRPVPLPINSPAVRNLNALNATKRPMTASGSSTPSHSQPSSPMKKESSQFRYDGSAFARTKESTLVQQKMQKLVSDRTHYSRPQLVHPTSPLRVIDGHSPVPRLESPISQEDEEVVEIVRQGEQRGPTRQQCDSVLNEDGARATEEELEECEQGSPCTSGGLHMPNSRSFVDFAKRVRRLRFHSQCGPDPELPEMSTGSSPGNGIVIPTTATVRRTNSCPNVPSNTASMKHFEKSRETVSEDANKTTALMNGIASMTTAVVAIKKQLCSVETQTHNFWPMPYEHLFLGIFPSLESAGPSPAPSSKDQQLTKVSFSEILDKCIDAAVNCGSISEQDIRQNKLLRDQLNLVHLQLQFERYRRDVHAEGNRRLLAEAKNNRALEEHNSALKDQVQLHQREIENLKLELERCKTESNNQYTDAKNVKEYWENMCKIQQKEKVELKQRLDLITKEMDEMRKLCDRLDQKYQQAEAALFDANAEVKIARAQALAGERGRNELEHMNRELLLAGELQLRYKERLGQLSCMRRSDHELLIAMETYHNEIKAVNYHLEQRTSANEAYKHRLATLEITIQQHEEDLAKYKRLIEEVKEEYHEQLRAVESKYQTQVSINKMMEERILELWQRIESTGRKGIHSPDTSSCHEANTTLATGAPSPQSSPLSASLASSEGSMAFLHSGDCREMKNLQVIVDQTEEPTMSKSSTLDDVEQHSSSAKASTSN